MSRSRFSIQQFYGRSWHRGSALVIHLFSWKHTPHLKEECFYNFIANISLLHRVVSLALYLPSAARYICHNYISSLDRKTTSTNTLFKPNVPLHEWCTETYAWMSGPKGTQFGRPRELIRQPPQFSAPKYGLNFYGGGQQKIGPPSSKDP